MLTLIGSGPSGPPSAASYRPAAAEGCGQEGSDPEKGGRHRWNDENSANEHESPVIIAKKVSFCACFAVSFPPYPGERARERTPDSTLKRRTAHRSLIWPGAWPAAPRRGGDRQTGRSRARPILVNHWMKHTNIGRVLSLGRRSEMGRQGQAEVGTGARRTQRSGQVQRTVTTE